MKNMQVFCKRAQACGFTSLMQVRVFLSMAEFPGEVMAKDIADATGIASSQVAGVFKTLSDWGLVDLEKRMVLDDLGRRVVRIYATFAANGRKAQGLIGMEVAP